MNYLKGGNSLAFIKYVLFVCTTLSGYDKLHQNIGSSDFKVLCFGALNEFCNTQVGE